MQTAVYSKANILSLFFYTPAICVLRTLWTGSWWWVCDVGSAQQQQEVEVEEKWAV